MSSAVKTILSILILILIAAAVYWFTSTPATAPTDTSSAALPTGDKTDDASLAKDLDAIDAQIGAFDADSSSVDQGLADSPVTQPAL